MRNPIRPIGQVLPLLPPAGSAADFRVRYDRLRIEDHHDDSRESYPRIRLDGIRAAITGGTSGLGLALVRELHERGARVAFVARTPGRVDDVARGNCGVDRHRRRCGKERGHLSDRPADLGNLGGLDVLINNASSLGPVPLALLADTECEELEQALATNVVGPFRLTKALLGALSASARAGRGAVVLNVSSDAAITPIRNGARMARARPRSVT